MQQITDTKVRLRLEALSLLRKLCETLPALTADIFYQTLREGGFTELDAVRVCGAAIRTASSRGWLVKTSLCVNSVRNHSNLQNVWQSRLFRGDTLAQAALTNWERKGFRVPVAEVRCWLKMEAIKGETNLSV
jgi:hypothetical protein